MQLAWKRWEMYAEFWSENMKGRDHFRDLGSRGSLILILKWILKKQSVSMWTGFVCEHGNEPSGLIEDGEILD
jgi:hypothetical protein